MNTWKVLFSVIAMLAITSPSYAQHCACCGGVGAGNYDTTAETTLTGTVDQVNAVGGERMMGGGVHLILNTPSGQADVHVGPTWFVSSKTMTFAKGDALTITGSNAMMGGKAIVVAREITKGSQVLTLRDAKGRPLWSGPMHGR